MSFAIFIHRSDSIYDDSPAERYQFPSQYLSRVQACVDDWIVYYEPRKVPDTRGYFAVAKVQEVISDPSTAGMYLALIEVGSYLDFADPVPFSGSDGVVERSLLNEEGRISGRAQSAVRPLSPSDFSQILERGGVIETAPLLPRVELPSFGPGLQEEQTQFLYEQDRDRISVLNSRIVRDQVFRRAVLRTYDSRCAITGLRLINGGGRAEVEAAHIRPVRASGPDLISNGLALSGTAHWMFDRGLIGIADDLQILITITNPEQLGRPDPAELASPETLPDTDNQRPDALRKLRPAHREPPNGKPGLTGQIECYLGRTDGVLPTDEN